MNRHANIDLRAILAEFPGCACQSTDKHRRIMDGFGNVGTGRTWAEAAADLRRNRAERAALLERIEREAAENRDRIARTVGAVILWGAVALALVVGVFDAVRP